jgi:hypothetical protein
MKIFKYNQNFIDVGIQYDKLYHIFHDELNEAIFSMSRVLPNSISLGYRYEFSQKLMDDTLDEVNLSGTLRDHIEEVSSSEYFLVNAVSDSYPRSAVRVSNSLRSLREELPHLKNIYYIITNDYNTHSSMILFNSSESLSGGYCEEVTDYDFIDLMEKEVSSNEFCDLRFSLLELIENDHYPNSMELMSTLIGSIFLMYKYSSEDNYLSRLVKEVKKYLKGDKFNFTGKEFLSYLEPDDVVKDSWKILADSIIRDNITETKTRVNDSIIMLKILRGESFQGDINFTSLMKTFNIMDKVIKSHLLIKYLQEKCQTLSPTN